MEQEKKNKKKKEKPKKSLKREIFEWVMVFVVAAAGVRRAYVHL